jgi:hypothetical protein
MKTPTTTGAGISAAQGTREFYEVQFSGFSLAKGYRWHFAAKAETLKEAKEKLRKVSDRYEKRIIRVVKSWKVVS